MDTINYFESHMLEENDLRYMWHYTNVSSFIEIVKNKELRFTDCLFLNDIKEFNYIFTVFDEYILQKRKFYKKIQEIKDILDDDNSDFLSFRQKNNNSFRFGDGLYYVLSGSSCSDLLPLWNYYSKNNKYEAYSLKIDILDLFNDFKKYNQGAIFAGKVIYNLEEQLSIIEDFLAKLSKEYKYKLDDLKNSNFNEHDYGEKESLLRGEFESEIYNFLNQCRLFFKDSQFSFESEIRVAVLATTNDYDVERVNAYFNSINGIVRPQIGISLTPSFPIKAINISPLIDKELAEKGIKRLFKACDISVSADFKVEKSNLTIRF